MKPLLIPGSFGRALYRLPVLASAALVAASVILAVDRPWLSVVLVLLAGLVFVPSLIARIRFRRMMLSGDVHRVLATWRRSLEDVPQSQAAEPMMSAMLYAAYGWVDEARKHLHRARFDPQAFLSREHLLFVEALVEAFDGDRQQAMESANQIATLPMPAVNARLQRRVLMLRASLGALTRAFAHRAKVGDLEMLEHTAEASPLVSWAMRYAAAIVAIDRNEPARAASLIADAPAWPEESAFHDFHAELQGVLGPQLLPHRR